MRGLLIGVLVALLGCGGGGSDGAGAADTAPEDTAPSVDTAPGPDTEVEDIATADGGVDVVTPEDRVAADVPPPTCFDGLPVIPWTPGVAVVAHDYVAPDLTVNTLNGVFTLSEAWTGCDHFVFVLHNPVLLDIDDFWASSVDQVITDSAPNVHYLFAVVGQDAESRQTLVAQQAGRVAVAIEKAGMEHHWDGRMHFVTDDAAQVPLLAGALDVVPWDAHLTVDRAQRLREGHSVSYMEYGAWKLRMSQVRYWAKYYNAQYALNAALAAEEAAGEVEVIRVVDGVELKGTKWVEDHPEPAPPVWTLPDAETLAQYGRMEIDMRVDCPGPGHPYSQTCGEWDTVGWIKLCGDEVCTPALRRNLVKWVTPYSAPGRWTMDISQELVALAAGGEQRIVVQHGDNNVGPYTYRYTVDLRLSERGDGLRPVAIEPLIPQGGFSWKEGYHDNWDDFVVTAPAGTERVELHARITGHGMSGGTNCAEFCTFTHQFTVNGTPFAYTYLTEHLVERCAMLVEEGVTPNQGGTWPFDRSSWCPGWVTEEWREDVTAAVDLDGGETTISYLTGLGGDADGTFGGGNMNMRVELVYYQ